MLVWYEEYGTMDAAISREKAIKEWKRAWKIRLIGIAIPNGRTYTMSCYDWTPAFTV